MAIRRMRGIQREPFAVLHEGRKTERINLKVPPKVKLALKKAAPDNMSGYIFFALWAQLKKDGYL